MVFWYPKLERETKREWERDKKKIDMDSSNDCKNFIDIAKLAEQAECYDEMVDAVKKMVTLNVKLTLKERTYYLLVIQMWLVRGKNNWESCYQLSKKKSRKNEINVKMIIKFGKKMKIELTNICNDIMIVIVEHLKW